MVADPTEILATNRCRMQNISQIDKHDPGQWNIAPNEENIPLQEMSCTHEVDL